TSKATPPAASRTRVEKIIELSPWNESRQQSVGNIRLHEAQAPACAGCHPCFGENPLFSRYFLTFQRTTAFAFRYAASTWPLAGAQCVLAWVPGVLPDSCRSLRWKPSPTSAAGIAKSSADW